MLDIGWAELMTVGVVALIVIGPKDLPDMFRTLGRFTAKARSMAREFSRAMEQAANESGVKDVADDLRKVTSPQSLGLNAVKDAAAKFEKWDPLKNAAKPSGPAPVRTPTPATAAPAATAAAADAPAVEAAAPARGPATQALAEKQAAKKAIAKDAAEKLRAADAAPAAKPAPKPRATKAKADASVAAATPAATPKPRAPRKPAAKKSDA
jgi:sec-independent protein translocase protein TatB